MQGSCWGSRRRALFPSLLLPFCFFFLFLCGCHSSSHLSWRREAGRVEKNRCVPEDGPGASALGLSRSLQWTWMVTEVTRSSITCPSLPHLGAQTLSLRQLLRKPDKVSRGLEGEGLSPHRAAHTPWGTGLCLREQMRYRSGTVPPCIAHRGASAGFLTSVSSSTQWELWWPL